MDYSSFYDFAMGFYGKISRLLPFGFALPPVRATIEATYGCNLRCQMCYQKEERKNMAEKKELTLSEIKSVIDQMPPKTLISLTGGEILTKNYAIELINYAAKNHSCNIVTNATLITKNLAKELVASNLILLGVSLDGPDGLHDKIRGVPGTFEKAVNGIKMIQEEKARQKKKFPLIDIKTVILPENASKLFELYKLCEKLKADFFTVSVLKGSAIQLSPPIMDKLPEAALGKHKKAGAGFGAETISQQIRKIIAKNKEGKTPKLRFYPGNLDKRLGDYFNDKINAKDYYSCTFPWTAFNVSPYGDIFPCLALNVGNIKEASLGEIWNGKKMREFRKKLKKAGSFPACHGCCNLWFKKEK